MKVTMLNFMLKTTLLARSQKTNLSCDKEKFTELDNYYIG